MVQVVFVPGIFGTKMRSADGFELWPPIGQSEPMDPETRARGLIAEDTKPDGLLENIPILPLIDVPEYGPILKAIGRFPEVNLIRFAYDWRADIADSAAQLAETIKALPLDEDVVLVAHSMGGLVCRIMLESKQRQRQRWFRSIKSAVLVATPHLGAPEAIFRVTGLEGLNWLIFPGTCLKIMGSVPERFPAGHQLLPPSSRQCVRLPNGRMSSVAASFPEISKIGLEKMEAMHAILATYSRPTTVQYKAAWGYGQSQTSGGAVLDDRGRVTHDWQDGDGTVPVWSAMPGTPHGFFVQSASFRGTHLGILNDVSFIDQLQRWIAEPVA